MAAQLETSRSDLQTNNSLSIPRLPIQLTNTPRTCLDDLNEYCLLEIFSNNSLTSTDLCSLAETCTLFKQITQEVYPKLFSRRFSIYCGNLGHTKVIINSKDYDIKQKTAHDAQRAFTNFGSCVTALTVDGYRLSSLSIAKLNKLVTECCVAGMLKHLHIERIKIYGIELKPIFQQLRLLNIGNVDIECDNDMFAHCHSLTTLTIRDVPKCDTILTNNFPKLKEFSFSNSVRQIRYDFDLNQLLLNFIERHNAVQRLQLSNSREAPYQNDFLQTIGNRCKKLKELVIQRASGTLDFSNLETLKRLTLHYNHLDIDSESVPYVVHVRKLKSLKDLELIYAHYDFKFFKALYSLKKLRRLDIKFNQINSLQANKIKWRKWPKLKKLTLRNRWHNIRRIVDIIRQLTKLEELDIDRSSFVLSEKEFSKIIREVSWRPHVLTLKCEFKFSDCSNSEDCIEARKVRLIKQDKKL